MYKYFVYDGSIKPLREISLKYPKNQKIKADAGLIYCWLLLSCRKALQGLCANIQQQI
jgi:hypothetical protein